MRVGARDALHAAVMKNSQVHMLVSVDRDFDVVSELKRIEPTSSLAGPRGAPWWRTAWLLIGLASRVTRLLQAPTSPPSRW
jgi:hypothetical protein